MVTVIKAGNALPALRKRTRGIKKGQDLPTERATDQDRSPRLFRGLFCSTLLLLACHLRLQASAWGSCPSPPALARPPWPGRCEGSAETGALAGKA